MGNNDTSLNGSKLHLKLVWRDGRWVLIVVIR